MPLNNPLVNNSGIAILDFGDTPSEEASVVVTDQIGIDSTSSVRVWIQGDTMGSNNTDEHKLAAETISLFTDIPTPNVGFTIYAVSRFAMWTKRFRLRWSWR